MREVYFDGKAKLHMEEYLNNRTDNNEAFFVSNNKPYERLKSRGIELMLQKLGKDIGEEKVHPHKFRRTLSTKIYLLAYKKTYRKTYKMIDYDIIK